MKQHVFATAAILALSAFAVSAAPSASGHGKVVAPPSADAGLLYDQNNNDGGVGLVSQNFEASLDAYDAQGADDFTVKKKKATITGVNVTGVYFNGPGPARDETVYIYKNAGGLPGALVKQVTKHGSDSGGSFAIKTGKIKVKKGTYWVSVQPNMDFGSGAGEWGWEDRSVQSGSGAAWQNPGDGFATGCTSWAPIQTCLGYGPDLMFSIAGK